MIMKMATYAETIIVVTISKLEHHVLDVVVGHGLMTIQVGAYAKIQIAEIIFGFNACYCWFFCEGLSGFLLY